MTAIARAYVGLGSNLDGPTGHVRAGAEALRQLPDSRLVRCSSLYRTAPVGVAAQPDFINAVCAIDTALAPLALMQQLLAIEAAHGRTRGPQPGAPRTLDLDLLLYDDVVLGSKELTVPHPRMHERAFVLEPLFEIAPDLHVAGHGPLRDLRARCGAQRVTRLNESATQSASAA